MREPNRLRKGLVHSMAASCIAQILQDSKSGGQRVKMKDIIGRPDFVESRTAKQQFESILHADSTRRPENSQSRLSLKDGTESPKRVAASTIHNTGIQSKNHSSIFHQNKIQ